ncbi:MAG: TPM domain-containing protein [Melioribacteraceae bacterium]|nr:TPM domain-containing protein [Melioribacteraceae bacterium]
MNELVYHFFSDDDFLRISNKISESEKITSGEIRVSIKEKRPIFDRNKNLRDIVEKEFYRLNMHQTRDKTGVLLYFLLGERQFFILADQGINEKVDTNTWEILSQDIRNDFKNGNFTDGILKGIEKVGLLLSRHFPIKPDDSNELTNKVVI